MKPKIETYTRRSAYALLKDFCTFSMGDGREDDFIEVTAWKNEEGYDVNIYSGTDNKNFSITYGQLKALKKLVKVLDVNDVNDD